MKKISIRFGIKGAGMFPNAGVFVKSLPEDQARLVVEGLVKLQTELDRMGNSDLAGKLVAEYRRGTTLAVAIKMTLGKTSLGRSIESSKMNSCFRLMKTNGRT